MGYVSRRSSGLSKTLGRRLSHIGNEAVGIFFVFGCFRIFNEAAHVFMRLGYFRPPFLAERLCGCFIRRREFLRVLLLALLGLAFSAAEP